MYNLFSYRKLFTLLAILSLYISCDTGYKESTNGFPYQINRRGDGEKVTYGNYIYTYFSISTGDSILFETPEAEGKRVFLRDPKKSAAKVEDPVLDVLPLLSVGDSATVTVLVDDLMRLSDDLKNVEKLYYHIVVKSIETPAERKKAEQAGKDRRAKVRQDQMLRRSLEMQESPEGGRAYQRLRTAVATYSKHPKRQRTASGLEYIILEQGEMPFCQTGEEIEVHYIGLLEDGTVFDETYSADAPFGFVLNKGRVIKAWDEGLQLLGLSGEAFFKTPSVLAYGATGYPPLIPPNASLYFYVKVVKRNSKDSR